jgi:hypothetical protein
MTQPKPLYRDPVPLNFQLHRHKRMRTFSDYSVLSGSHAVFVNAVEFPHAAIHFPIVFVPPTSANPDISPVAMMGLIPNDNLFVEGSDWLAGYVPAYFRRLPYATAPVPGSDQVGIYIDQQWPALSETEGEPLFGDDGKPAPALAQVIDFLKAFDEQAKLTTQLCQRLQALGLFTDMKAELTLPNGQSLTVDGFMVVDEAKFAALSDAVVIELYRSGALGIVQAHLLSLQNLRMLMDRHVRRMSAATTAPAAANDAA